jgi:uncharacterized protein (DUF1499 family)
MTEIWILEDLGSLLFSCAGTRPKLGIINGKFAPCPDMLNCLSSRTPDRKHTIATLFYRGSAQEAKNQFMIIINSL